MKQRKVLLQIIHLGISIRKSSTYTENTAILTHHDYC